MKKINSLNELTLPTKHRQFLDVFLKNVSQIQNRNKIEHLILFGSCARGEANEESDVDLVALGENIDDATLFELYDCPPNIRSGMYVANDVLAITNEQYEKHINDYWMIQKHIAREGIDLSGLL